MSYLLYTSSYDSQFRPFDHYDGQTINKDMAIFPFSSQAQAVLKAAREDRFEKGLGIWKEWPDGFRASHCYEEHLHEEGWRIFQVPENAPYGVVRIDITTDDDMSLSCKWFQTEKEARDHIRNVASRFTDGISDKVDHAKNEMDAWYLQPTAFLSYHIAQDLGDDEKVTELHLIDTSTLRNRKERS